MEVLLVLLLAPLRLAPDLRRGGLPAGQAALREAPGGLGQLLGDVQAPGVSNLVTQGQVLHQLRQGEAGDVLHRGFFDDDLALVPGPVLGVGHALGHVAALQPGGFQLPAHRVLRHALQTALQQSHPGPPAVRHFHPAAGAPDAHDHGRGADIQGLVVFQLLGHVEEQVARPEVDLQLFSVFPDLHLALRVLLQELRVVQVNPGVALLPGFHVVAAVEPHLAHQAQLLPAALADLHSALGPAQPDGGGGLRRRNRRRQCHQQSQQQGRRPDFAVSHPRSSFYSSTISI